MGIISGGGGGSVPTTWTRTPGGGLQIAPTAPGVGLEVLDSAGQALVESADGQVTLSAVTLTDGHWNVATITASGMVVNATAGGGFAVNDYPNGNPVFRVDGNGSVHIKTGTSILADL